MAHNVCAKICSGPMNRNDGIGCSLFRDSKTYKSCKHNPLSQEKAHNLIRNGGRHSICLQNPWRYDQVQEI